MPRPRKCRRVCFNPGVNYFKPRGIPLRWLDEVNLTVEELEAIRLADFEGLEQENAGNQMKISRQTFGRVLISARKKIAEALILGKALRIEGGDYSMPAMRKFCCSKCNYNWELAYGTGRPAACPQCKSVTIRRAEEDRGCNRPGRGLGACRGPGRVLAR